MSCLTLFINQYCNRLCNYCDIPTLTNRKSLDKNLFQKYLPLINNSDFDTIILTGGEIGLLDKESINLLFKINKKIEVNTNGLFIKKYLDNYYHKISRVQYHPIKEINERINYIYTDKKIEYLIPIHTNNVKYLESFLSYYSELTFEISPYDSKLNEKYSLTKKDYIEIFKIIEKYKNVTKSTINTFKKLITINDLTSLRNICNCNLFMEIDFTSGFIHNCVCSYTRSSKIKLTLNNFNNINKLKFDKPLICDSCLSCVVWFDELVNNKLKKKIK